MNDEVVYKKLHKGRMVVVKHMTVPGLFDYYCGYAEVLPTDPIITSCYSAYDDDIDAPGGLTFGGELSGFPGKRFLGFDTAHPWMRTTYGLTRTTVAATKLADSIASCVRAEQKQEDDHE